jgi:hypothetical protein
LADEAGRALPGLGDSSAGLRQLRTLQVVERRKAELIERRPAGRRLGIADLEFELKQSSPPADNKPPSPAAVSRSGGRPSDKEAVIAEAQRRVGAGENIPPSKAAFARDLHFWLDKQPWAYRGIKNRKVLGPAAIEENNGPLWRKYRQE